MAKCTRKKLNFCLPASPRCIFRKGSATTRSLSKLSQNLSTVFKTRLFTAVSQKTPVFFDILNGVLNISTPFGIIRSVYFRGGASLSKIPS